MSKSEGWRCGVVEGFYGRPWNARQRHTLFQWMQALGLNTYLYAPKDDLKHRVQWDRPYEEGALSELTALARDARRHGIQFIYAVAPGLGLVASSADHQARLEQKLMQLLGVGVPEFALLFDDIPGSLPAADVARYGSVGRAQSAAARFVDEVLKKAGARGLAAFCPTRYCGRMVAADRDGLNYLRELGEGLPEETAVFWTGDDIISERLTEAGLTAVKSAVGRSVWIWDNLYANDYDERRLFLGPYVGRAPGLVEATGGLLCNLNNPFEANFVPLRCFADYCRSSGGDGWDPLKAHARAIEEWGAMFTAEGVSVVTPEMLSCLADAYYLPHGSGPRASVFLAALERATQAGAVSTEAEAELETYIGKVHGFYDRVVEVESRDLMHALYPYAWRLKEEMLFARGWLRWARGRKDLSEGFRSAEFDPRLFCGGFAAELHELLPHDREGRYRARPGGGG